MSVLDLDKIDGMALTDDSALVLLITDHLDWENEYDHLIRLQNKINAYIAYCEEKEYESVYPEREIRYAIIEIHFLNEPTQRAYDFFNVVQDQVGDLGIRIRAVLPKDN